MLQRLPLALSATALAVALFGSTPLGEAAGDLAAKIPPLAQKAKFATTAGTANNAKALGGHRASEYVRLGPDGKLAASLGAVGAPGPQGPKGDPGAKGDRGPAGPNGADAAFTKTALANPIATATTDYQTVLSLPLGAGKYVILARAHIGQGGKEQYSGFCRIVAGGDSDYGSVQGAKSAAAGGTNVGSGSNVFVSVIHEFAAAGGADLKCWSPPAAATTVSDVQITAIQLASSAIAAVTSGIKGG
jgi:hypothetical protein